MRLSAEDAWQFVAQGHTGILITLRRDGVPIATPMWFAVLDRQIYVQTPARSKKVARLRRDPRVSFLVEAGERWAELRAVHITGQAQFVEDAETLERVAAEMERKYARFRTAHAAMPEAARRHYQTPFVLIRVVPDAHVISWDNRKLRRSGSAPP